MYFKDFTRSLRPGIKSHIKSYGHTIEESIEGIILVNKVETGFNDLEEARQYIIKQEEAKKLEEEIKTDLYEELSDTKIAAIIQEQYSVKVTDTLIVAYKELASSKLFTLDPVVTEIHKLNKLDTLVEGKLDYKLNDNSIIAIDEATQQKLNSLFGEHQDVVEYMRESAENFLKVIQQIKE